MTNTYKIRCMVHNADPFELGFEHSVHRHTTEKERIDTQKTKRKMKKKIKEK